MEKGTAASPPSYTEAADDAADDVVQPVILVLDGQSICAESDPTVHLYEFNRGIAQLGPAASVVEFSRIERSAGSTKQRPRHIYNLHHPPRNLLIATSSRQAEYFIQAVAAPTRRLGHLGLKSHRIVAKDLTALPVDMKGWAELDWPPFVAGTAPVIEVHHRQGAWKWTDGDGNDMAMEYDSDQGHRLLVTASLQRETLDALVALWCCRVWQQSVGRSQLEPVKPSHLNHTLPLGWKKFR